MALSISPLAYKPMKTVFSPHTQSWLEGWRATHTYLTGLQPGFSPMLKDDLPTSRHGEYEERKAEGRC